MAKKRKYNRREIIHNNRYFREKLERRGLSEDIKRAKTFRNTERYIVHLENENKELKKNLKKKKDSLNKIIDSTSDMGQQNFLD